MENRTLIKKYDLCSIYESRGNFEVQFNIERKGQIIHPTDEDFGVWAWNAWTLEGAEKIANEIEIRKRIIVPMIAQV